MRLRWALLSVSLGLPGCFFYDSRWGQSTVEQKHAAARLQPAAVEARPPSAEVTHRTARVRACATRAYVAETLDWKQRFEELLRSANTVLEPSLGLTLESAAEVAWEPPSGEASLGSVVSELPTCEGPDADWVVGLVESTSMVVTDFHVLGMGRPYSPYLAMRASNDPAELAVLSLALPDLDAAKRDQLYSDRKRHKTLAVFLHELGHTLGALHRTAKDTLMSPTYAAAERGFDDATLTLLGHGVAIRLDHVDRFGAVRAFLEHADGFVEAERSAELARLAAWGTRSSQEPPAAVAAAPSPAAPAAVAAAPSSAAPAAVAAAPSSAPPAAPVTPVDFSTLPREDRKAFDAALTAEPTDAREAWRIAAPLFEEYPAVRPIQDLRCRLAKARKFFPAVIEAHCARLAALGGARGTGDGR